MYFNQDTMKKIINKLSLLLLVLLMGSLKISGIEIYQKERDKVTDVHSLVKEIRINDAKMESTTRPFILGKYLIIGDYKSYDKLIHIFKKDDFTFAGSTAGVGQGPGEIMIMGEISTDEKRNKFYVSDHGKQKIFSYDMDSTLTFPDYMPTVKAKMNRTQFPDRYQYINDTLSFALMIDLSKTSAFKQSIGKWNMQSGQFKRVEYVHPDIIQKGVSFSASIKNGEYVECYAYHDLMSILNLNGDLICNVYGPSWDKKESTIIHHYGAVTFCGKKILALYSGEYNFSDKYNYTTKILVYDLHGKYLKTLDVGYKIEDFCYDKDNNRLIFTFDDEIQLGYLDLKGLI